LLGSTDNEDIIMQQIEEENRIRELKRVKEETYAKRLEAEKLLLQQKKKQEYDKFLHDLQSKAAEEENKILQKVRLLEAAALNDQKKLKQNAIETRNKSAC
jgi:hemerythrin superfamily protein